MIAAAVVADARAVVRAALHRPLSTACVLATLALSVGVNLVLFEAVRQLLFLPPAGVVEADRLVRVSNAEFIGGMGWLRSSSHSYPTYEVLKTYRAFDGVMASVDVMLSVGNDRPRDMNIGLVTHDYFRVLGARVAIGRSWSDQESVSDVVVLSDASWRAHWNADLDVIGQSIRVGQRPYTIIGIAEPGFMGIGSRPVAAWLPLGSQGAVVAGPDWRTNVSSSYLRIVARLPDGVTEAAVSSHLNARLRGDTAAMTALGGNVRLFADALLDRGENQTLRKVAMLLQGLSALLLVAACAGAGSLLMGRMAYRRQAFAIRLALGAPDTAKWRIALIESLAFAVVATLLALGATIVGGGAIHRWLLPTFAWREDIVSPGLFIAATAICGLATVFVAACEAVATRGVSVLSLLNQQRTFRQSTAYAWQGPLLGVQASVVFLLVVGAGLFSTTLHNLRNADLGFDADRLLVVELDPTDTETRAGDHAGVMEQIARGLMMLPEVGRLSHATSVPLDRSSATWVRLHSGKNVDPLATGGPYFAGVDASYFSTLGTKLLEGRSFTPDEVRSGSRVIIVNEAMRTAAWGATSPLGSCVLVAADPSCFTVVGVVQDAKRASLREGPTMQFYVPPRHALATATGRPALFVRTRGRASESLARISGFLQANARTFGRPSIQLLEDLVDSQVREWRFAAVVISAYGVLALVVALVSFAGALALAVEHRRGELAVRRALGAPWLHLARTVATPFGVATFAGLATSAAALMLYWNVLAELLFRITPLEVAAAATTGSLIVAGCVGCGIAIALAASRVSAAETLR